MGETIMTDLFKFVAIRPAQRVTEKETRRTIIRDERKANPDGAQTLALLARKLAPPGAALARWREFDLSALEPLADGYRALVRHYEQMDTGEDPPDGRGLLTEVGVALPRDERYMQLRGFAWDALYTADRTGPDAGPRLETPMAALRVLHFAQLLGEEAHPTRASALEALRATPAIPTAFHDALPVPATPPQGSGRDAETADISARSTHLRRLAQELDATERLFELVTSAPALTMPPVQTAPNENTGGWTRSQFSISTVPTLRSALTRQLTRDSALLLDRLRVVEETPVPVAAQMIQSHLSKLSGQAFALGDDQEFQGYMRELNGLAPGVGLQQQVAESESWSSLAALDDPGSASDVNVSGRIIPLGIGDLKVVKQTLIAYVPGEVAHIENVLKGELKERKHRKLDRTETTLFTSEEETKETERDTQSTDRFELKREAEQTIKEDMSIKAGLNVTATFGPVVTTATGDFAYSTSKQDSQKSSSNFAREVVDRSVSKLQTKTKTERTTKTLSEVEEINTHGLNNTSPGTDHVIGIYRWVDKRYRAQIYNYGVRLLLEFIVPEPAAFYRATQLGPTLTDVNATPPADFLNLKGTPLTVADITEADYTGYVSRYNAAGVTPPPAQYAYVGASLVKENLEAGKTIGISSQEFVVPEGYLLNYYTATLTILSTGAPKFTLQVGGDSYPILNITHPGELARITSETHGLPALVQHLATRSVPVSVGAYDVKAFAVNVQASCFLTTEHFAKWQLQTFDKIYTAYRALQTAYDQKVAQAEAAAGITIQGHNPATNRIVEKTELKKLCITMMTGQHFKQFDAIDEKSKPHYPEVNINDALDEGRIVQFFEQAFEWEQMTYLYYPYFWGRKKNWVDITHLSDPDPLFAQFLTAGYARVVVPVPMAYRTAVEFMLQEKGTDLRKKVWFGGDRPTLENENDDLYVSIAEELRNQTDDLAGATPEGTPWEFTLPTTLVWLQPDATLPRFEV